MFLWLLDRLSVFCPKLAAAGKITFRASMAAIVAFLLAVLLGPRIISWLRKRFREPVKSDSPEICRLHRSKSATPTMGGLFIVAGLAGGALLFGDLSNVHLQLALFLAAGLALLGAVDDLAKLRTDSNGLPARAKLVGQVLIATAVAVLLYRHHAGIADGLDLNLPLLGVHLSIGLWFVPLAVMVIVGTSNAVNLTDGLDGLAAGCLLFAAAAMGIAVYAAGHAGWAEYLNVPRIPGAGEMTVMAAAMIGGLLGFLWFNCHPAQVFMGDTGSLALGGLLAFLAVAARQELLLLVVGGVFVAEAVSVILQVGYFKWRRRRIFRCAPLHHHFQFQGWPESKIVVRFWIAAVLCAVLGLAALKGSVREEAPTPAGVAARLSDSGEMGNPTNRVRGDLPLRNR